MKKIKLNGKLSLNKETIAKLNDDQLNDVVGGARRAEPSNGCTYFCESEYQTACEDPQPGTLECMD